MENLYPLFAGGRILKKESLWNLRDYAYGGLQLLYADYTDGVIKGCRVRVENNNLIVGKGIMKYGDFIFLMDKEVKISFEAENCTTVLKAAFEINREHSDYLAYEVRFFLDHDLDRTENQIELCRFHLRTGSFLRDTYKNFSDMETQYDTVNLLYSTVAGRGRERLHPEVLLRFAEEMQSRGGKEATDKLFCYELLNSAGEVETALITAYLEDKGIGLKSQYQSGKEIAIELMDILNKSNAKAYRNERKNVIYVE